MNWKVTLKMELGLDEKIEYTDSVDLDGDVSETIRKMNEIVTEVSSKVENAKDSILFSSRSKLAIKRRKV
jgi:hypothetical protein